jgi:Fe2+ transport system protein FeoA
METQTNPTKNNSDEKIMSLLQLQQNHIATVIAIDGCSNFQNRLSNLGIHKNKVLRMVSSQPFSGPLTIEIDRRQISLGKDIASKIIIVV